jgi:membrane-associated phospholipid phosphatase
MAMMARQDAIEGVPTPSSFFVHIMLIYGYIPYLIAAIHIIELLVRRGTRELSSALFLGFVTLLNEVIFKNFIHQQRPERSCLSSCGMPSGHSTMAIGLLTVCLLDTALRVAYRPEQDILARAIVQRDGGSSRGARYWKALCNYIRRQLVEKFTLLPISSWDELSQAEAVLYSTVWFLLLFPVPLARVTTRDHTSEQVALGSCVGFCEGLCWIIFARSMQHRYNHLLGKTWSCKNGFVFLTHNFALPRFIAEQRVLMVPSPSKNAETELRWYEETTSRRLDELEHMGVKSMRPAELKAEQQYLEHQQRSLQRLRKTIAAERVEEGGTICTIGESSFGFSSAGGLELSQANQSQGSFPQESPTVPPPAG